MLGGSSSTPGQAMSLQRTESGQIGDNFVVYSGGLFVCLSVFLFLFFFAETITSGIPVFDLEPTLRVPEAPGKTPVPSNWSMLNADVNTKKGVDMVPELSRWLLRI